MATKTGDAMGFHGRRGALLLSSAFAGLLLFAGTAPCAAEAAPAAAPVYEFDIPAESLIQALKDFSAASSQQIVFSDEVVGSKQAPALRGRYTSDQALGILLKSTDLAVERSKAGVIMVRSKNAPSPRSEAEVPAGSTGALETVVVTGTLIRGVMAPTGSKLLQLNSEDILKLGVTSAPELLATIPQVQSFNMLQAPNADWGTPTTPVNLRGLGIQGSGTLVLLNGHRIVGEGVLQTAVDPNMIPTDIIERVDVLPDGGSATYGSDAIGGVINFITRTSFDGFQVRAKYGNANHYNVLSYDATAGTAWGGGSAVISFSHTYHDAILGKYRDYVTTDHTATGGPDSRSTYCGYGNISVGGVNYAAPDFLAGTQNKCDSTDGMSIYPQETRNSVFGYVEQQLTPSLLFSMDAHWTSRNTKVHGYSGLYDAIQSSGTITSANPYFHAVGTETSQTVTYSYANSFGTAISPHHFEAYGFTPKLTWTVNDDWQVRAEFNYGESFAHVENRSSYNAVAEAEALAGTTTATALDPYDTSKTDPTVLSKIMDWEQDGRGTQTLEDARLIADGSLFRLPGGDLRLAFGGEYKRNSLQVSNSIGPRGQNLNATNQTVSAWSYAGFAEVLVPLVGEANSLPMIRAFNVTASIRYDHYSDFGGTTNPRYGFTYKPIDDLTIRGNYQTAFHAPSLADNNNTISSYVQTLPISPYYKPSNTGDPTIDALINLQNMLRKTVYVSGAGTDLKPETANMYSFGGDYTPRYIPNLKMGLTYWWTSYKNIVDIVHPGAPDYFSNPAWSSTYIINPTQTQLETLLAGVPLTGFTSLASLYSGGQSPYIFIDARLHNIGAVKVSGLDFDLSYAKDMSFGTLFAGVSGSYKLSREQQLITGSSFVDYLSNGTTSPLGLIGSVGLTSGPYTANVTVKHTAGYDVPSTVPLNYLYNQTSVDSFTTVDLFFSVDLGRFNMIKNTLLTLNIDNVFDTDPPYSNSASGTGYTNGGTIGRLITGGIQVKL